MNLGCQQIVGLQGLQSSYFEKVKEVYLTVAERDDSIFKILLHCLNTCENRHIVEKLRESKEQANPARHGDQIYFDIPKPLKNYIGRDAAEHRQMEKLLNMPKLPKMMFLAICGPVGVGKSETAKYYAKRFQEEAIQPHCIWINAETNFSQLDSFRRLALALSLSINDGEGNPKDLGNLVREIYETISQKKCLLILNHIQSYEGPILKILTNISQDKREVAHPFVLITSELSPVGTNFQNETEFCLLGHLTHSACYQFVIKALALEEISPEIEDKVRQLCEKMNDFPFALQQAVSTIERNLKYSTVEQAIESYLTEFEIERIKISSKNLPILEDSKILTLSWKVILEEIKKKNLALRDIAESLMAILAFFGPSPISISLLTNIFKIYASNKSQFSLMNEAAMLLEKYSMLTIDKTTMKISVHGLIQDVIRSELKTQQIYAPTINTLLKISCDQEFMEFVTPNQLIHLTTLWNYASGDEVLMETYSKLPIIIATKFLQFGMVQECELFTSDVLTKLTKHSGSNRRQLLTIKYLKGCALIKTGKYPIGRALLLECYEEQKMHFGEANDDTLRTAIKIGTSYRLEKQYEMAMTWYEMVITLNEKNSDNENGQTLSMKNKIALGLMGQEKYDEAFDMLADILNAKPGISGLDDLHAVIVRHNMAVCKFSAAKYLEAVELLKLVVDQKKNIFGVYHPETLRSMHVFAKALKENSNFKEALNAADETYEKQMIVLGIGHPDTMATKMIVGELKNY